MNNKILACIIFILLSSMLSGCYSRKELVSLAIVQAIGIDSTEDGKISLTVQIIKPAEVKNPGAGKAGGSGKGVWVLTSTGETLFDAFRNATIEADRKLYISHNKVIVIGEDTAKSGIKPILDFLDRDHEPRLREYMFVARGKAKDILEGEHEEERIPAKAIEDLAKATFATSKIPKIDLLESLITLASETSDPFIPGIQVVKQEKDEQVKELVELDGTAVFKDDKLIGWFDGKETRGLLWVLGKVKSGIIVVKSPREETKNVSLEIIKASGKVKPEITGDKLTIKVIVKEEGNLAEQMSKVDLTKPDTFKELEEKQAAAIEEEINAALIKAQKEWAVDIFKFGEAIHSKLPKEWINLKNNWREEYKNIEVKVEVEAKLRRIGMTNKPD